MSIFGKEVDEAASKMGGNWVKAAEFDGKGIVAQVKGVEKVQSQYGAEEGDAIAERGILGIGETFRYTFIMPDGTTRTHDSSSFPMFIGMQQAQIEPDEWYTIRREGKTDKTRYYVEKTEVSQIKPDPTDGIPF